ncbi:hypothetical protein AHOG_10965 [Actinoalloteichus hoggarensis]|uniref:Uncharacterized protein n=1 Tax=Actinoalloteichus hoggarensis TaxID=1470176 RepID=A0A221W235_9PSEU|nr:hypothetical protein AHOG_10965 [Actinoalloteichus hoggarensis]
MVSHPVAGGRDGLDDAEVAQSPHRRISGLGGRDDPRDAGVLPPQDRSHERAPVDRAVGVAEQTHPACRLGQIHDGRSQTEVLPAHVREVVHPSPRRGQVPVEQGRRAESRAEIAIHRVPGREIVMADDLGAPGGRSARGEVVERPNEPSERGETPVRHDRVLVRRGPGDVALDDGQRLATPLVEPEESRGARPAPSFRIARQLVGELGIGPGPAYRVADADDVGDETTRQKFFTHSHGIPAHLPRLPPTRDDDGHGVDDARHGRTPSAVAPGGLPPEPVGGPRRPTRRCPAMRWSTPGRTPRARRARATRDQRRRAVRVRSAVPRQPVHGLAHVRLQAAQQQFLVARLDGVDQAAMLVDGVPGMAGRTL